MVRCLVCRILAANGYSVLSMEDGQRALALAKKVQRPTREEKQLLAGAAAKLRAAEKGLEPPLPPLAPAAPGPGKTPGKGPR